MTKNTRIDARLILLGLALCAAAPPAQAQIAFHAAGAQVATGTGTSLTPVIPAGTQAGDFAVLIVVGRPPDTTQPAAPTGWTLRSSVLQEVGAHDVKTMTFYRVLTGGDANPTITQPVSWRVTGLGGFAAAIAVWRGVNPTTPFDVADVTGGAAAAATWVPPTITTLTPGAWVVSAVGTSDTNQILIHTAQGFTGRMTGTSYDTTSGGHMAAGLADKLQAAAGTPTMLTWREQSHSPDPWSGITFALRPAAAANAAPTVSLTSPANGATFTAPAMIVLTANAQDTDGTVAQVEFFQGATLVATDTAAPFTFTLTNVAAGSYSFTARATDNLGATTTSAAVSVTVNAAAAAQLYFIHTDHLNTPRLITNGTGQAVWRWDQTDAFGGNPPNENPSGLGTFTCNLRLPGQYFDQETNTHYNYQRDAYDPAIGGYTQPDPLGLRGGLSGYAYAYSAPLTVTDPTGEVGIPGAVIGGIIGGGAYLVGQVLSGQPVQASGLVINTLAGAASGATGAYIFAGVAKLGLNTLGNLALNAAGNAVANAAISGSIQAAQNVASGKCPGDDIDKILLKSAFFGGLGGYTGARIAGLAPAAATAMQQYANRVGNILLPKGPAFTGTTGAVAAGTAGAVNAFASTTGNVISNYPTIFP